MTYTLQRPASLYSLVKVAPAVISTGLSLTSSESTWGERAVSTLSLVGGSLFALPSDLYNIYFAATAAFSASRFLPDLGRILPMDSIKEMSIIKEMPSTKELERVSISIGKGIAQGASIAAANILLTLGLFGLVELVKKGEENTFSATAVFLSLGSYLGLNELYKTYFLETREFQYFTAQVSSALCIWWFLKS